MTKKVFDSLLVIQCQSGDKKSFTLLVKRWHIRLCKHAYRYTHDVEASKDIVQDSWQIIMKRIHSIKNPNSFGSWALTIVTRKSLDWLRKNKVESAQLTEYLDMNKESMVDDTVNTNETVIIILKKAIYQLPANHQIVLTLFYTEEYSIQEIANILHISVGTVKSRLFTAREKLKQILKHRNYEK